MGSLKAAYINEMYKISKKKKIIVSAILYLGVIAIAGLISVTMNNFMGIRLTGSGDFSVLLLSVLNSTLIPLFTAFICIDMFNGEFHANTIKFTLTRPASRFKIYLAKALAAATFILLNLLFVFLSSMLVSLFINGMHINIFKTLAAYLAAFLPLMVFALLVILISNIAKGSASAFMISILLFLAMMAAGLFFSNYQSFFFTSMFDWYNLFMGSYISIHKIIRVLLILCGSGLMLFAGGYYLFEKKDF